MATTFFKKKNNAFSTLLNAISSGATSLQVQVSEAARFPSSGSFQITVWYASNIISTSEIMTVTAAASNTFTITRAQENTAAQAWDTAVGTVNVWHNETAAQEVEQETAINALENRFPVVPADLATNAITLTYVTQDTDPGQTFTNSNVDIVGLAVAIVTPSGGRRIRITCQIPLRSSADADEVDVFIQEGSTQLARGRYRMQTANQTIFLAYVSKVAPSAGSHSYKITANRSSGSGTITNGTNVPPDQSFIHVEVV